MVTLSTSFLSRLFQEAFGQAGLLVGVIVFTILGVPSSGGAYPVQMLPDFFQWLNNFLPLRFATDGVRSILFFGGNSEAGLGAATLALSLYAVGGLALAWAAGLLRDKLPGQPKPVEQLAPAGSPAL